MNDADNPVKTFKGMRVLLVDDDAVMLQFVTDLLYELGVHEVLTASDGANCLLVLGSQNLPVDLLLCDLQMPGMDGVELLRNLAVKKLCPEIAVALISGVDVSLIKTVERLASAHGLNFMGTIEKPISRISLSDLLERVVLHPLKVARTQERMLTLEEAHEGLARGEVGVYFQPKVSVLDRRVLGAECLARWRHPQRGILAPDLFMKVIEQHGLTDLFTLQIMRKAFHQLAEWARQTPGFKMSVNISVGDLDRIDLPEAVEGIVRSARVPASSVVLEITESQLMRNQTIGLDVLARLRLKGFGLSIDDFGTGYATMETLKNLPFTELKVDRAFVSNATHDSSARAILESSIHLGKIFNLNLVAEGVETPEDWELVASLGCNEIQGDFVAKPMSADDFGKWKSGWN